MTSLFFSFLKERVQLEDITIRKCSGHDRYIQKGGAGGNL